MKVEDLPEAAIVALSLALTPLVLFGPGLVLIAVLRALEGFGGLR